MKTKSTLSDNDNNSDLPLFMNYLKQQDQSSQLIDKLWATLLEKQQSINRQLEKIEEKYKQQSEENNRLIEESEKKYFQRIDKKKLEVKEVEQKIYRQIEENRIKYELEEHTKSGRRKTKKLKNKKLNREDDYRHILDIIASSNFSNDEEQELLKAISVIYQKFGKVL